MFFRWVCSSHYSDALWLWKCFESWQLVCLFNSLYRPTTKKLADALHYWPLVRESKLATNRFPSQRAKNVAWWRHQMESFSALLAICAGNSPVQWRGALMFSLIGARIDGWVNNDEAGDLRRHRAHCNVIVMESAFLSWHYHETLRAMYPTQLWC